MGIRTLLAELLIVMGVTLSICAQADTYKLPVRTATLVVSLDHYGEFVNGEPVGPYEFYIDPPVLRVGLDAATNMVYDSFVMFDLEEYSQVPADATIYYSLYLATASAPDGVEYYLGSPMTWADTPVPEMSDFDWSTQVGQTNWSPTHFQVNETLHDTYGPTAVPSVSGPDYIGWLLTRQDWGSAPIEIAGINNPYGMEGPHILVTTVPEPSSLGCLGTAVLLLGGLCARTRGKHLASLLLAVMLVVCASTSSIADLDSEPGEEAGFSLLAGPPLPPTAEFPSGYKYLPAFPRFLWSFGCAPTTGAMIAGYYDNAGFPRLYRHSDGSDAICPVGNYPYDNGPFLEPGDPEYPSECDISASDEHVYDYVSLNASGQYWWGHNDDRWYTQAGGFQWYEHAPWNCTADYMGANIYYYRHKSEGSAWTVFQDNLQSTAVLKWKPFTWPYPNVYPNEKLDMTYGLAQYVADYGGYWCETSTAGNGQNTYHDVSDYYTRVIRGYVSSDPDTGVWPQDIIDEIDAGRPVIAILTLLTSTKHEIQQTQHAFPVFGYKEEEGQPLKLLAYDTWLEDVDLGATYRTINFPTAEEVEYKGLQGVTTESLYRASNGQYWKLVAFSFLKINDNARCPLPLGTNDYPSSVQEDEFDIDFDLPAGNSRVHYSGRAPTPGSPYVELDANGDGTLLVDQDCVLNFRTYRDATLPDGYLASDVVHRVYSVFSANKNVKKWADDTEVTMVNGLVTHVIDSDNFYFEERDKRLFGIRVHKANHGLQGRRENQQTEEMETDEVEVVVGDIETDANDERYIDATTVTAQQDPADDVRAYGLRGTNVGGQDYSPPGGSGTGFGQQGVENGIGVNNVGMLVRITGIVTNVDTNNDNFTISDGSGAFDSADNEGVKVSAVGLTLPDVGDFVTATGICTLEKVSGYRYPVVLARDQDDLVVVQ